MAKYGRSPEQLSILPGVTPIIGASEAEAKEKLNRLQSWLTPTNALILVTGRSALVVGTTIGMLFGAAEIARPAPDTGPSRWFARLSAGASRIRNRGPIRAAP